ncbi:hypothetical protein SAMN05216325_10592 [Nitrosomonas marina]|uniref:Uncharacterized protein n=1 Tax=Nitrosomonas marina TaxID=917 RepID=A0A1H8CQI6_9PROT|nr:hypothetical protein [Nitrosomonas marina]SEM97285.1 hypothetical protein SAMN05216325_10592 [Nitrosomonas marina]
MVQKAHQLPRTRRCELLKVARSSSYYQPQQASEEDQVVMRLIDRIHMDKPFLGSRRIVDALVRNRSKICTTPHASHGHTGDSSRPKDFEGTSVPQDLSISVAKPEYQPSQSGVVYYESIKLPKTG